MYLKDWVVEHKIDFLTITETWLDSEYQAANTINELCPRGYALMHVPRNSCQGGGVGLLYNKCYKMEMQNVASYSSFEYMENLFRLPATILRIEILYRPPPSTKNGLSAAMFFKEFPDYLSDWPYPVETLYYWETLTFTLMTILMDKPLHLWIYWILTI